MTSPKPIRPGRLWYTRSRSSLNSTSAPLAQASIARDLEEEPDRNPDNPIDEDDSTEDDSESEIETLRQTLSANGTSMVGSYRRPSFTIAGSRATVAIGLQGSDRTPSKRERHEARREERSLLRDNNIIPPKHPQKPDSSNTIGRRVSQHLAVPKFGIPGGDRKVVEDENNMDIEAGQENSERPETTPLLGDPSLPYGGQDSPTNIDKKWEDAVLEGRIHTTWQREAKVLGRYSGPLVLTFMLQYSLTVASIFTVGHLGTIELGAVSLASMTANITGYAVYQGLATCLDTLCAQAYGSGRKKLVGLQTQRMVFFLWAMTIPIAIVWLCADLILMRIVPEKDVAILAGLYLKIVLIGAPGYATFESIKRYLQAQGIFSASLYVLLICAPLNAFMNWLFVWVCYRNFLELVASLPLAFVLCYRKRSHPLEFSEVCLESRLNHWSNHTLLHYEGSCSEASTVAVLSLQNQYIPDSGVKTSSIVSPDLDTSFPSPYFNPCPLLPGC